MGGSAIVRLCRRQRQFINIYTGANDSLLNFIQTKGINEFISFLSSAKWIHITSLKDAYQFQCITEYVKSAKNLNPNLKVSIDPGHDYTKHHLKTVKKIMSIADFAFLSKSEWSNLSYNMGLSTKAKILDLGEELIACGAQPQIVIVKGKRTSVLMSLIERRPYIRTYHHKVLNFTKILNDTGAGDAFAGGFIVGLLSPFMLSHQPATIYLATIAANERLKSLDWPTSLRDKAQWFYSKNMKNEKLNRSKWLKIHLLNNPFVNIVVGIAIGLVTSAIWEWLKNFL